ncbi:TadE/TadG family type IV pilus assembly protein [Caulobacter sp. KR2-114]|uniref:TadE/TadG family type IV pilus assembly protein n=1 Tax=Caulobacter sp. KR2-114 TaxID=3400912 RepID=UPI003BFA7D57
MRRRPAFLRDQSGASAAEFAIITPVFFALVFAVINFSIALYAYVTLHFATEDAARCYSLTTSCADANATQTYAAGRYAGPNISPVFVASNTGQCHQNTGGAYDGHLVTGSGSMTLNLVLTSATISFSTQACFP